MLFCRAALPSSRTTPGCVSGVTRPREEHRNEESRRGRVYAAGNEGRNEYGLKGQRASRSGRPRGGLAGV